ncbi:hypothetical protein [Heyndrickxia sporothermodurans]
MTDIPTDLIRAAEQARMIDPSDLRILSRAQLDGDPAAIVAALREQRPNLFHRTAREMSPAERSAAIAEAKVTPNRVAPARRAQAEPPAPTRSASVMLLEQRAQFLRDHEKKFPGSTQGMSLPRKSSWRA